MKSRTRFPLLLILFATLCPVLSWAQETRKPVERKKLLREVQEDAYLPNAYNNMLTSPATNYRSGRSNASTVFTRQVNVNSSGQNIIGDAGNEPSITMNPLNQNQFAIGWRQFDNVSSNFRQAGWAWSNDTGNTWNFPGKIEPGIFRSDPVLDYDRLGNFYYNSLTNNPDYFCKTFKSTNAGVSWNSGTDAQGGDKQWITIDRTTGVGSGNIYSSWNVSFSTCFPGSFTRSEDDNQSYDDCITVPNDPYWQTMVTGDNGTVYIGGAHGWEYDSFLVVKSFNAQQPSSTISWNSAVGVYMDGYLNYGLNINPVGLLGQTNIDIDRSGGAGDGNLYLVASVTRISIADSGDVMFVRSTNDGLTWSTPVRINDDVSNENVQWMATMSVAPNGRIDVAWLDTRDNPGSDNSALYYSYSTDQGTTWSPNEKLSSSFNPHLGYPNQLKMGDYFDMLSRTDGAHLAWANTLNGEQDVYYSHIIPPIGVGVNETAPTVSFSVSPNPSSGSFVITTTAHAAQAEIYNLPGEKVFSAMLKARQIQIDFSAQPAGVYFLKIIYADGSTAVKKVVLAR
jgi:hypothetical protein